MSQKKQSLARQQMNALSALEKAKARIAAADKAISKAQQRKNEAEGDVESAKLRLKDLGIKVDG